MRSKKKAPPSLISQILNAAAWIFACTVTFIYSSIGLLIVLPLSVFFDRDRRMMHAIAVFWARSLISGHPLWKMEKHGLENVTKGKTFLIVANHQSIVDILVVLGAVPGNFKFIAKKELFSLPWLGWHMWGAGYVGLDRGTVQSGRDAVNAARKWLDRGVSVLFFPEGTRSEDGEIHAFKNGAFKIALEKGIDILPVVLDGTGKTSPKKSGRINEVAHLEVEICKPVSVQGETLDGLREKVRGLMIAKLRAMRAE